MLMWMMIAGLLLGAGICWLATNSKFKLNRFEWALAVLGIILILLAIENINACSSPRPIEDLKELSLFGQQVHSPKIRWDQLFGPAGVVITVIAVELAWLRQGKEPTSAQLNGQPQTDVAESEKRPTPDDRIDDSVSESSIGQMPTDVSEPAPPKRKAVDEIRDLSKRIHGLQAQVGEIDSFVHASQSKLTVQADEKRLHNIAKILDAFMRIYNNLDRRIQAMASGGIQHEQHIRDIFDAVETELKVCGVSVIRPQLGDPIDLKVMNLIDSKHTTSPGRANSVAALERCGYMWRLESGNNLVEKAEVVVYRDIPDHDGMDGNTN